jgi:phosphatidate cytidylyltransferase
MLLKRILTTIILLPLVIAAVWFQQLVPWFTILIALWAAVAVWEFYRLNHKAGLKPSYYFGIPIAILFVLVREEKCVSLFGSHQAEIPSLLWAAAVVLPLIWSLGRKHIKDAFANWAWTLAGIGYVGFLLSYLVALRGFEDGRNWVFFALFVTFASDTTAFFIGRTWGRHKLAVAISPSKTWEGSLGGLLGAGLISLVFLPSSFFSWNNPLHLPVLNIAIAISLAFLVSIFGQIGDLVESLFKRNMNAKDSGNILPGHGGALDRLDSVAFAGVMVYYFVWLIQ